jgi:hypothetical protein
MAQLGRLALACGLLLALSAPAGAQTKCSALTIAPPQCGWTSCVVDCADGNVETQLRDAVHLANQCGTTAGTPCPNAGAARTISFQNCSAPISLALDSTNGGRATCSVNGSNFDTTAICLSGNHITIDGSNAGGGRVNFVYDTPSECIPSDPVNNTDEDGKALFLVTGSCNTIKNMDVDYFPEGIHVNNQGSSSKGNDNRIDNVDTDHICDDVFSIDSGDRTTITECDLTGFTDGCSLGTGCLTGKCGRDKAIQIGGGVGTKIRKNRFTKVGQAINVNSSASGARLSVECNDIQGSSSDCGANPQNICQALNFDAGRSELAFNRMSYC